MTPLQTLRAVTARNVLTQDPITEIPTNSASVGLKPIARREVREYLETHCKDDARIIDKMLAHIQMADVDQSAGLNFEVPSRYTKTGNPLPFTIEASDFLWKVL